MTRQLISTNRQLLLRHVTRSVRRAAGFVQVRLWEDAKKVRGAGNPEERAARKILVLRGHQE